MAKTTKKSVFDFIESQAETIFVYVSMKNVNTEAELIQLLKQHEAEIISGKVSKRRSVKHKSSSKIVFSDDSNLYKTDKIDNNYSFTTEKLQYYVRDMAFEIDDRIVHKFMCYATEL